VKGVVVTRVSKIVGGILVTILILFALGQYQVHENCPTERRSTTHSPSGCAMTFDDEAIRRQTRWRLSSRRCNAKADVAERLGAIAPRWGSGLPYGCGAGNGETPEIAGGELGPRA
jgi:hypothetical protein